MLHALIRHSIKLVLGWCWGELLLIFFWENLVKKNMPAHCVSVVKMASSLILKVFVVGNLKGKEQHGWMEGCALRVMHVLQHYIMCLEIYRIIFEMLQILSKRCWAVKVLHMDEGTLSSQYDPSSSIFNNRHPSSSSSSIFNNHHPSWATTMFTSGPNRL